MSYAPSETKSELHPYGVTRVDTGAPKLPTVACLIIGIDGWEKYTQPLVQSIRQHEPGAQVVVMDNESVEPYPWLDGVWTVRRDGRMSYSAAINMAWYHANMSQGIDGTYRFDWYVVLSNDVLCTGPFLRHLATLPDDCIAGPDLKTTHGWRYLEGWCVAIPRRVWDALGGWDEGFIGSSWEDVALSVGATQKGFRLAHVPQLPFRHLDQKQRFYIIPDYWSTETANVRYFMEKYASA